MPEVALVQWNEYLKYHPESHFLQAGEWGELKSRYGWSVARLITGDSGAQVLFRQLALGIRLAYIPRLGPDQIRPGEASQFWREVQDTCIARGAIACKIEPDQWETDVDTWLGEGVVSSPHSVQPRRTVIVDLLPDEESILSRMRQKCRYNIRLAQKKGVVVRPWTDMDAFHSMLKATGARDGFAVHSRTYYADAYALFHPSGACELLVAEAGGQPLSALMVFARGTRAWYVYGGSSEHQREKMPNYLLQWEAMRWAKARGCSEYDLWGVPDEPETALEEGFSTRSDGLWGVYRFKRGFGGEVRRSAPALDWIFNPGLYRLYLWAARGRRMTA